jgi:hypothetical protein
MLPNVRSFGKMRSLHNAMSLDQTGQLEEKVRAFISSSDVKEKKQLTEEIIHLLSGTGTVANGSRGGNFDAKKLKVIETYLGMGYNGRNGSNPNNAAAPILEQAYNDILNTYYMEMIVNSTVIEYAGMLYQAADKGLAVAMMPVINAMISLEIKSNKASANLIGDLSAFFSCYSQKNNNLDIFNSVTIKNGKRDRNIREGYRRPIALSV